MEIFLKIIKDFEKNRNFPRTKNLSFDFSIKLTRKTKQILNDILHSLQINQKKKMETFLKSIQRIYPSVKLKSTKF